MFFYFSSIYYYFSKHFIIRKKHNYYYILPQLDYVLPYFTFLKITYYLFIIILFTTLSIDYLLPLF